MSDVVGLDGLLEPLSRCLDAESARRVVDLQIDPPVQERIDQLAERANEGALTDSERSEYEALINAADFISILKHCETATKSSATSSAAKSGT